ncbi:signal peptidase II [Agrococcus sp. SCSIO52902]|uniref:signal peptidase II n=1 Tax=Agrococcus sp. SCSIO52902 TaxID=2933290 RepID=UPI001FF3CEE7|nr:signal peptidase II [Agrococcus sp. SCSIO52902]UOW00682.1 signal peptidase II [Agrococcus sp. SCSIO52902]
MDANQTTPEAADPHESRALLADGDVTQAADMGASSTAAHATAPPRDDRRRRRAAVLGFVVALLAVSIDQLTKVWAEATLTMGERHPLLADLLALQLAFNPGAAFSLGASATPIITVVAIAGSAVAASLTWRTTSLPWAVGLGLILGGALGNVIDRLARAPGPGRGHVVDFIAYADWFIGNVADVFVFAGMALCVILAFNGKRMRPPHAPQSIA